MTGAPLFPKFVSESFATDYELRKRGTGHRSLKSGLTEPAEEMYVVVLF